MFAVNVPRLQETARLFFYHRKEKNKNMKEFIFGFDIDKVEFDERSERFIFRGGFGGNQCGVSEQFPRSHICDGYDVSHTNRYGRLF